MRPITSTSSDATVESPTADTSITGFDENFDESLTFAPGSG